MNSISFSTDEIHSIREEKTKKYMNMTNEELKEYFKKQDEKFYSKNNKKMIVTV